MLQWPDGPHNKLPSIAFDFCPYVAPFGRLVASKQQVGKIAVQTGKSPIQVEAWMRERYFVVIGALLSAASVMQVSIRTGSDWNSDGDGNLFDHVKLEDLPHIELRPRA